MGGGVRERRSCSDADHALKRTANRPAARKYRFTALRWISSPAKRGFAASAPFSRAFQGTASRAKLSMQQRPAELYTPEPLAAYLAPSPWIDFGHPDIQNHLAAHPRGDRSEEEVICADFEFVRDQVAHSWDIGSRRVTGCASEVLRHREGICYAKSHLLAALLRGRGIPAGIGYQRLTLGDTPESGYCVHALNTAWVASRQRWIRLDARGNKPGVDAQFSLDEEWLAFAVRPDCGERDYGVNHAAPHPEIMRALEAHEDCLVLYARGLPTGL